MGAKAECQDAKVEKTTLCSRARIALPRPDGEGTEAPSV